jgi:anti-sigma B factor antagonist
MPAAKLSPDRPFSISVVPDRQEVIVVPRGELDLASADALDAEARRLRASGFAQIVIDLREVEFIDSTGLGVLLSLRNDAKRDGHDLTLVSGPRAVQRVFELTATRGLFDWRD